MNKQRIIKLETTTYLTKPLIIKEGDSFVGKETPKIFIKDLKSVKSVDVEICIIVNSKIQPIKTRGIE